MADTDDTPEDVEIPPHKHPLLMEDILDKIFPYFDDPKNLGSFRLVCKTWKTSAARTVKKNLRWKIGPTLDSEKRFMEVMKNCADDMFGNFLWTYNEKTPNMNARDQQGLRRSARRRFLGDTWHKYVQPFLEKFGPLVVNLVLKARDPIYVDRRLQSSYLPNLEHLELYDISEAVLTDTESFKEVKFFGKLKSVCFDPKVFQYDGEVRNFNEGEALICDRILEAASALKDLEINLPKTTSRVLKGHEALALTTFASLTSFTISPEGQTEDSASVVALDRVELQNLLERCPNLKVLRVTTCADLKESEVCGILAKSKVCAQLEELRLRINNEDFEFLSDDSQLSSSWDEHDSDSSFSSDTSNEANESAQALEQHLKGMEPRGQLEMMNEVKSSFSLRAFLERTVAGTMRFPSRSVKRRASSELPAPSAKRKNKSQRTEAGANTKKRPRSNPKLPEMQRLKKLALHNWTLRDVDIFRGYPLLREVDLELKESRLLYLELDAMLNLDERDEHSHVKYLRLRDCEQDIVNREGISALSKVFPNLEELDVKVEDDDTLTSIFEHMTKLRRLNLNESEITDSGITGLSAKEMKTAFEKRNKLADVEHLRDKPYIGNLSDLQEFTYTGLNLTKYSIHFGIAALKDLRSLKMTPPRRSFSGHFQKWIPLLLEHNKYEREQVDIGPLLTNCKYLVRLDVNGKSEDDDSDDSDFTDDSDEEEAKPKKDFKGCGLKKDQIKLVKEKFPNLDLVYGEKVPRS